MAMHSELANIRAIFFDLDDTLCNYWEASKAALRSTFDQHPVAGYSTDELYEAWAKAFRKFAPTLKMTPWYKTYLEIGEPTRTEQMRLTLSELGAVDEHHAKALSDTYGATRDANLRLFDDALDVLNTLKEFYPLGLITNGPADIQRQELRTLNIEHYFDPVLIEGELGFGKPEPDVYAIALRHMQGKLPNLSPSEILMVGNSFGHDILGAHLHGWKTAWIRRDSDIPPSTNKPEEKPEGSPDPTTTIYSLTELLNALPNRG